MAWQQAGSSMPLNVSCSSTTLWAAHATLIVFVLQEPLEYPSDLPDDVSMGVNLLLNQIAITKGEIADFAPATLMLSIIP